MTAVTNTCTHNTHTHTHTHTRTHTYTHKYIHTHTPWPDLVCSLSRNLSLSLSLGVPACVSEGGDALLAGGDENSWQSRPRHACASSAFHTPSSRLHAPCAIQQQATVMVLLDASAIARNVGRDLVFAARRRHLAARRLAAPRAPHTSGIFWTLFKKFPM